MEAGAKLVATVAGCGAIGVSDVNGTSSLSVVLYGLWNVAFSRCSLYAGSTLGNHDVGGEVSTCDEVGTLVSKTDAALTVPTGSTDGSRPVALVPVREVSDARAG